MLKTIDESTYEPIGDRERRRQRRHAVREEERRRAAMVPANGKRSIPQAKAPAVMLDHLHNTPTTDLEPDGDCHPGTLLYVAFRRFSDDDDCWRLARLVNYGTRRVQIQFCDDGIRRYVEYGAVRLLLNW